ncbi:AAA family ATPase [Lactobacillus crispatus]|uniref:AAA family ATPase n=1 Tax=Lactobacillus crispatus TaxID=47770 RepID=UPI003F2842D1
MKNVLIFKGSNKDFESEIKKYCKDKEYYSLRDLVEIADAKNVELTEARTIVIRGDEFASLNLHVISNFVNSILSKFQFNFLLVQNPPFRVEEALLNRYKKVLKKQSTYYQPSTQDVLEYYKKLIDSDIILGQENAKHASMSGLFKQAYQDTNDPLVLLYYGSSGIGKTELAKHISKLYKGRLTRIQFSMMQTEDAVNYIFGSDNSRPSLARDLISRESNVVLIDEFDKVSPAFYNVFYQMFDEGKLVDSLYKVDLKKCIFILTSNFSDIDDVVTRVGMPIFSRIDKKIKFEPLTTEDKESVIRNKFEQIINKLHDENDRAMIRQSNLEEQYLKHADDFSNIRMLNKIIENNVYDYLLDSKLNKIR